MTGIRSVDIGQKGIWRGRQDRAALDSLSLRIRPSIPKASKRGRILTFALGGQAKLNVPWFGPQGPPPMPGLTYDSSPELVHKGAMIFNSCCMLCHGLNAVSGPLP